MTMQATMGTTVSVVGKTLSAKQALEKTIQLFLAEIQAENTRLSTDDEPLGDVVILDGQIEGLEALLRELQSTRAKHRLVMTWTDEDTLPSQGLKQKVDGVLLLPFNPGEWKVQWNQLLKSNPLEKLRTDFESDISMAEALQENTIPKRFRGLRGFEIACRHFSGLANGGDYFDLFESPKGDLVHWVLTDSSSHRLQKEWLGVLLDDFAKELRERERNPRKVLSLMMEPFRKHLKAEDRFQVFYGVLNRRDLSFQFLSFGDIHSYFSRHGASEYYSLGSNYGPIHLDSNMNDFEVQEIQLQPRDRLLVWSDGFPTLLGGEKKLVQWMEGMREEPPVRCLNELAFQLKETLPEGEDFPNQDCSAVMMEIDARTLRIV
jgi:hypothetical protein